jgi:hypothetical protein
MLTLRFHSPSELTLGPSRSFTIEGAFIRQSPHNEIVCRCTDNGWHLEDETAPSFECADRSHVQFEDTQGRTSPVYGPFRKLHFAEDRCFADEDLFAEFLPDRQQWRHLESGVRWRILTVKARDS